MTPVKMAERSLNTLEIDLPKETKMMAHIDLCWWPGIWDPVLEKTKFCTSGLNAGNIKKLKYIKLEKRKATDANDLGEELPLVPARDIWREKMGENRNLLAVHQSSKSPLA